MTEKKSLLIILTTIIVLSLTIFIYNNPFLNLTGKVVDQQFIQENSLNITLISENNLSEEIYLKQNITFNSLSGKHIGEGNIEIFLIDETKEYKIYSTKKDSNLLTGFVTLEEDNSTFVSNITLDEFVEVNFSEEEILNETPETNITINQTEVNISEPILNESETNITNETLDLNTTETNTTINNTIDINTTTNITINQTEVNISEPILNESETNITINETPINQSEINTSTNETNITGNVFFFNEKCNNCKKTLSNPKLKIEIEGNIVLFLDKYAFTEYKPIEQTKLIPNISIEINQTYNLDIEEYFTLNEKVYFDIITNLNSTTLEKSIVTFQPKYVGAYQTQVLITEGVNLVRSNTFYVFVGMDQNINYTQQTLLPWVGEVVKCNSGCCIAENSSLPIGSLYNDKYICAVNQNNSAWIKIEGGSFQIKDKSNNLLFIIDEFGNAWSKNSLCNNIFNNCEKKFEFNPQIKILQTGHLISPNVIQNSNLEDCDSCIKIKNKEGDILAQILDSELQIKGKLFTEQVNSTSCNFTC